MIEKLASLFHPLLLRLDPEISHRVVMSLLRVYKDLPNFSSRVNNKYSKILNLPFSTPLGLAAGFDKNAECLRAWEKLGFGFVEVGTITALPQMGNPKPRIFRVPEKKVLFNRMGFNNDGCVVVAKRIEAQRKKHTIKIPIGINIGKSKVVSLEDAAQDYKTSFCTLADLSDYITINVSSPNTPGLRNLQSSELLKPLLDTLCSENEKRIYKKPLFIKLSPDLSLDEIYSLIDLSLSCKIAGLIISNTSTDLSLAPEVEKLGNGGISGSVLFEKSTKLLQAVSDYVKGRCVLIGSGGVMNAQDVQAKLDAGASLVQVYTGFVYGGPKLIGDFVL